MKRRLLIINAEQQTFRLETLRVEMLPHAPREDYMTLHGESLCQYMIRRDDQTLTIARGPLAFLAGNKATVGYVSPLTGLPHYSFVGGRTAAQLFHLGLDAIVLTGKSAQPPSLVLVVTGHAPNVQVAFKRTAELSSDLPTGQRAAFYHLVDQELGGNPEQSSVLTLGQGAWHGYQIANLAADGIYHAGRGGAGNVFASFASALVLHGDPLSQARFFAEHGGDAAFARSPNRAISERLATYTARLSGQAGGTIPKLYATGSLQQVQPTLPARNATQAGHRLAPLGEKRVLAATRDGHAGCQWCPVDCRHWHWVDADYAPGGRDRLLDDFEPAYALFGMLDLAPADESFQAQLALLRDVDRRLILPIEQLGCDVMDVGIGLAALFEGLSSGIIPPTDVPPALAGARLGDLESAVVAVQALQDGLACPSYPALCALAKGPQGLAAQYPAMQDLVFTSGTRTLGNPGHGNALWTFLMPFSRYFGHYSGQIYKIDETLPDNPDDETLRRVFAATVARMLDREYFGILCNAFSCCAFTFALFSHDGQGERLDDSHLLVRTLAEYGIHTNHDDLTWFAQAFWAQSIDLKRQYGWRPPAAQDLPRRIYEMLEQVLKQPVPELIRWMDLLIDAWTSQAAQVLHRYGYDASWLAHADE